MKEIVIVKNEAGQRFDKWLAKYMNKAPKSFFYKMMRKKNITLNGKKAEGAEKLTEGDIVRLFLADDTIAGFREAYEMVSVRETIDVLYEDENILVINKPCGILSQKAAKEDVSLVEMVTDYLLKGNKITIKELETFRPAICNRLDRNTSGLVVAGKSLAGLQKMGELFADRSLHKYYRTIVKGEMKEGAAVKGYLYKNTKTNKVTVSENFVKDSDAIETQYRPVVSSNGYTLLEVLLVTGKTHQIRAHLASIGYPIIGDFKYGDRKTNQMAKEKFGLEYQLLHAYRLEFPKLTGDFSKLSKKIITAKEPEQFLAVLNALGLKKGETKCRPGNPGALEALHLKN